MNNNNIDSIKYETRQDGWITHIQRYCYSTAGLPWRPEKRGGGGKGGGRHIVILNYVLFYS